MKRKIGVIGMGYVGIPSAVVFASNFETVEKVYGFQRESKRSKYKIDMLNSGKLPFKEEDSKHDIRLENLLKFVVDCEKFECISDFAKLSEVDVITLDIQTPIFKNTLEPDYSSIKDGLKNAAKYMKDDTLVVIESTVHPGFTDTYAKEILENVSGKTCGKDFYLAHAPERVMSGRLVKNILDNDRVIGGVDRESTKRAIKLYKPILRKGVVIPMTSREAEITKTSENAIRDMQIAAANQLALYCESLGVNFYNVYKGISSLKGDGVSSGLLEPGSGVGGHCLPKDAYHLEYGIYQYAIDDLDFPFVTDSLFTISRKLNDFMPDHMLYLTASALDRIDKPIEESRIAVLGWSFLSDTDDFRNTPSETFYQIASKMHGADVVIHDPYIEAYDEYQINPYYPDTIREADAVVIMTNHREYYNMDPELSKTLMNKEHPIIVDGRHVVEPDDFIKNGWIYKGIGRGDKNYHDIRVSTEAVERA